MTLWGGLALYRVREHIPGKSPPNVNIVHALKARVYPMLLDMNDASLQIFWACLAFRSAYVTPAAVRRRIGSLLGFCINALGSTHQTTDDLEAQGGRVCGCVGLVMEA